MFFDVVSRNPFASNKLWRILEYHSILSKGSVSAPIEQSSSCTKLVIPCRILHIKAKSARGILNDGFRQDWICCWPQFNDIGCIGITPMLILIHSKN